MPAKLPRVEMVERSLAVGVEETIVMFSLLPGRDVADMVADDGWDPTRLEACIMPDGS